jgi:hypothetical protein
MSARDYAGPNDMIPHYRSQIYYPATSKEHRILFVSFSESETAFLGRVAKILVNSGNWECCFLLLHNLAKDSTILADFDAIGISHYSSSEGQFYAEYTNKEPIPAFSRAYGRLLQWWRQQKNIRPYLYRLLQWWRQQKNIRPYLYRLLQWWRQQKNIRPYLRSFVPLIRASLYIPWFFARYIPWFLRYGIKIVLSNVFQKVKQSLSSKHPRLYNVLRSKVLAFQSFLFENRRISESYLRIGKKREESRLRGYIDAAGRFYAAYSPDIIILAKDSAYYSTTTFVQAAIRMGIPSVVIPYDRADTVTLAKDRLGHPNHVIRSHSSREIAKIFPDWVYIHENQALLLVDPATVYALEQLKLAPPNPWGYNNSRCDKILLESEEDRQLYLKSGAPPNQLVVVGSPYMDSLDEILSQRNWMRAQLCSTFGFAPHKPFVVASVSPNKVSQRSNDLEFKSYRTLIDKWSTALVEHLDCNLIYSLHPLTSHADVMFIEEKGGRILNLPLEELIAVADLYVVDCSSTSRWARHAGVDVIDYDFYKYNLWFNSEIEGVRHVTEYNDFISELIKANERLIKPQYSPTIDAQRANVSFGNKLSLELGNLLINKSQNCVK